MNDEKPSKRPRNELRDWVKGNAALVTVTGVMLAAAVFSRSIGPGRAVVWLISCFLLLALLLMQEMFESFPPPGNDSEKLKSFKWILGSAMANLGFYWMLIVYRSFGIFWLGVVSVVLGLTFGEWLVKRVGYLRADAPPNRVLFRVAVILGCGVLASIGAVLGIPPTATMFEREFFGPASVAISGVNPVAPDSVGKVAPVKEASVGAQRQDTLAVAIDSSRTDSGTARHGDARPMGRR